MCNTVDVGCAIEADGVVFHIGSHLGAGMEAGLDRVVEAMKQVARPVLRHDVAADGELRRHGCDDRPLDRGAGADLRPAERHPRLGVCLDSCHLYASGYDVTDEAALDAVLDELDREIGLDRLRALHVNDSKAPLGSNRRPARRTSARVCMGKKLGVFLGHPKLQGLPAVLEVPGPDGHGPDADEVRKAKKLHAAAAKRVAS